MKKEEIVIGLISFCFLASCLAFATNAHLSYAQDALEYAYWLENGAITQMNRHFLWNLLFYSFHNVWTLSGFPGGALRAGQVLSALFGAAGLLLFYRLLQEVLSSQKSANAVIFTCFYAFSFAYWHFSGEANPQTFSNFLRLLLFLVILRWKDNITSPRLLLLSILCALVLLSELLGLAIIPAYLVLLYYFSGSEQKEKTAIFLILSITVFYIFYGLGCRILLDIRLTEIIGSTFSLASKEGEPLLARLSQGVLYFLSSITYIPGLISPSIDNDLFIDEVKILSPAICLILLFFYFSLLGLIKYHKYLTQRDKVIVLSQFLWLLIPLAMQAYREPGAIDNLFYVLPPLWIILALLWERLVSHMKSEKSVSIATFVLFILLGFHLFHNFMSGIFPNSRDHGFELLDHYNYLASVLSPDDSVIMASGSGNYEAYELDYLLNHRKPLNKKIMLLDGFKDRSFSGAAYARYERYKEALSRDGNGVLYLVILPGLDLDGISNADSLVRLIKERHFPEQRFGQAKYAAEVLDLIGSSVGEFEVLSPPELHFNMIKLTRTR